MRPGADEGCSEPALLKADPADAAGNSRRMKQIKRVGEGEYVLVSKAAPKKTEPKANGAAAVEATGA